MIYTIALLLIFIETTVSVKVLSMVVTLPFLTMTSSKDYKIGIGMLLLTTQIHSLQNENFIRYFFILLILYTISRVILTQMTYSKENILIFIVLQMGVLTLFFKKYLGFNEYIFNGIGMAIFNYIFIKISWRKQR